MANHVITLQQELAVTTISLDLTEAITPFKNFFIPNQAILSVQNKMVLVLERQKSTLDPFPLANIKRCQSFSDWTPVIFVAMDDHHRRIPIMRVARRVPFVPLSSVFPERAMEVGDRAAWLVGGDQARK